MRFETVQKVEQLLDDFELTKLAIKTAQREAEGIAASVRERLESTDDYNSQRKEELQEILDDPDRVESVKKFAMAELERIHEYKPDLTDEERNALDAAVEEARRGLEDLRRIHREIREAFTRLSAEIEQKRSATLGNTDFTLIERLIAGIESEVQRIVKRT